MSIREPIAFLSYVRHDDDHDRGRITKFREHLEGEVRMHTGRPFPIFQDRNDLVWGQRWEERIHQSLSDVTFLIPVITPSFFQSPACRDELETFLKKENVLGVSKLILPLYYLTAEEMEPDFNVGDDGVVEALRSRNWTDWRDFRFKDMGDEAVSRAFSELARAIKMSVTELASIRETAAKVTPSLPRPGVARRVRTGSVVTRGNPLVVPEVRRQEKQSAAEYKQTIKMSGDYYAYTKKYDEIIKVSDLIDPPELMSLFEIISKLVNSLRSKNKSKIEYFKDKIRELPKISRVVSINVDNSGSMRGAIAHHTGAWLVILGEALSDLNIEFEIWGYTTRAWKGGKSRELWIKDGKPTSPGRLTDIRHIIYKSFSDQFVDSVHNIGLMAKEGILKDNVDGEALISALHRVGARSEDKKIILVLSDGSPVDDSTMSTNSPLFLDRHLQDVIETIEADEAVTIGAVGIGHDVAGWYPAHNRTAGTKDVGVAAIDVLWEMLR